MAARPASASCSPPTYLRRWSSAGSPRATSFRAWREAVLLRDASRPRAAGLVAGRRAACVLGLWPGLVLHVTDPAVRGLLGGGLMPTSVQSVDWLAVAPAAARRPAGAACCSCSPTCLPAGGDGRSPAGWRSAVLGVARRCWSRCVGDRPRRRSACPGAAGRWPSCSYVVDDLTLVFQALVLAGAAVVVLLSADTVDAAACPPGSTGSCCSPRWSVPSRWPRAATCSPSSSPWSWCRCRRSRSSALRRYDGRAQRGRAEALPRLRGVHRGDAVRRCSLVYGVTGAVHLDRIADGARRPRPAGSRCWSLGRRAGHRRLRLQGRRGAVPRVGAGRLRGRARAVAAYLSVVRRPPGSPVCVLLDRAASRRTPTSGRRSLAVARRADDDGRQPGGPAPAATPCACWPGRRWRSPATCWCRSVPRASATPARVLPATVTYVLAYAAMNLARSRWSPRSGGTARPTGWRTTAAWAAPSR